MRKIIISAILTFSLSSLGGCTIDLAAIEAEADAVVRAIQTGARIADAALTRLSDSVCGSMVQVNFEAQRLNAEIKPVTGSKADAALKRANAALAATSTYCAQYQTMSGSGLVSKYVAIVKASKAAKVALADAKVITGL